MVDEMDAGPITKAEIALAIQDEKWQTFRRSLKGKSTEDKIVMLYEYYHLTPQPNRRIQVQVTNYINALRRGGLLPKRR